ncbi:HEAT repeat domain-containing protein [Sphaerisporangium sp. NPDC004334]
MKKAYVSSTYRDLRDERAAVRQALHEMRVADLAMEAYVAGAHPAVEKCLADVRDCDLYIGIFAWRYGHVPPDHDRAITELEYRAAVEAGIPVLIFLLHEDAPWPRSKMDTDVTRIEALRAELADRHIISFFTSPEELGRKVAAAVHLALGDQRPALPSGPHLDSGAVRTYYQRLIRQYSRLDLETLTPPRYADEMRFALGSVFVEQDVREDVPPLDLPKELWQWIRAEGNLDARDLPHHVDREEVRRLATAYRERPRRKVLEFLTGGEARNTVLLGDPGAGKSTLARYLMLALAGPGTELPGFKGHLPLLVELKSYAGSGRATFLDYLDHLCHTESLGLTCDDLHAYLGAGGPALVVFDGLDEIFDPGERATVTRRIAGFAERYPSARVLVTSRIIGYAKATLADAGFAHATLQDLDPEQIRSFLTSWYHLALHDRPADAVSRTERIADAVENIRSVREMAGNPLLLTILAIIGRHQELPRERWKVYEYAATVLVQRWDVERYLRDESPHVDHIGEEEKGELLRRVALRMQLGGRSGTGGNYLTAEELREEFEDYLTTRFRHPPAEATRIARVMIRQFRERNFILSRYGTELYGFVHRALLEYFCAEAYRWQLERDGTLSLDELKTEVFGAHWNDPAWREVLRLIAGMVTDARTAEIVTYLADQVNWPWPWAGSGDDLPWNVILAAQCLAEKRPSAELEEAGGRVIVRIVQTLEYGGDTRDLFAVVLGLQMLPTAQALGPAWPGRESYLAWFLRRGAHQPWRSVVEVAAGIAVGLFPDDRRLLDALLTMVQARYSREGSAFDTDGALPVAWPLLMSPAQEALQRFFGHPDHRATLLRHAMEPGGKVRAAAVAGLAGALDDPAVLPLMLECTADEDRRVRAAAVTALSGMLDDPVVRRAVLDRVADAATEVQTAVARALGGIAAAPDVLPSILRWSRNQSSVIWGTTHDRPAVVARGHLPDIAGDPGGLALLLRYAAGGDHELRAAAVAALGHAPPDDPAVCDALVRAVADPGPEIRVIALRAAAGVVADPGVRAAVLRCTADEDDEIRTAAAEALAGAVHDPAVQTALIGLCADSEGKVQRAAVTALGKAAGDPQVRGVILAMAVDGRRESRAAAITVLPALADEPEARRLLITAATDGPIDMQINALLVLKELSGDAEVRAALTECARSESSRTKRDMIIRLLAVQALGHRPDASASRTALLEPLISDHGARAQATLRTLVSLRPTHEELAEALARATPSAELNEAITRHLACCSADFSIEDLPDLSADTAAEE